MDILEKIALTQLSESDQEFIMLGKLNWSPKVNWVERENGLPKYIEDIAVALVRKGWTRQRAIATAVNRVKKWAAGGDNVKADTRAKAIAALAAWEKMKMSARARRLTKKAAKKG